MITKKQCLYLSVFSLVGFSSLLLASEAGAVTFKHLSSSFNDNDFNNAKTQPLNGIFAQGWEEDWVAEARGANNTLSGDPELFINNWVVNNSSPGSPNVTSAQYIHTKSENVNFSVTYNGGNTVFVWGTNLPANRQRTLQRNNVTEANRFPNGLDSIFIRLRSETQNPSTSNSFEISNLVVDGKAYNGTMKANNLDSIDYLLITGITSNFTLTGTATLFWTGTNPPTGSRLDMTIKMGYGKAVPEPLSILGAGTALGFGYLFKKRIKGGI